MADEFVDTEPTDDEVHAALTDEEREQVRAEAANEVEKADDRSYLRKLLDILRSWQVNVEAEEAEKSVEKQSQELIDVMVALRDELRTYTDLLSKLKEAEKAAAEEKASDDAASEGQEQPEEEKQEEKQEEQPKEEKQEEQEKSAPADVTKIDDTTIQFEGKLWREASAVEEVLKDLSQIARTEKAAAEQKIETLAEQAQRYREAALGTAASGTQLADEANSEGNETTDTATNEQTTLKPGQFDFTRGFKPVRPSDVSDTPRLNR